MKVITIGRGPNNDVVIQDDRVSRAHLQIVINDNGICSVVDLNSANGTFVNGERIAGEVQLQPNDTIQIGHTTLPWQEYINTFMLNTNSTPKEGVYNKTPISKNGNKSLWYITIGIILISLLSGIGLYYYLDSDMTQEPNTEKLDSDISNNNYDSDLEEKEEADRLQKEADKLFQQALILENNHNKDLAELKKREAEAKQKEADIAKARIKEAEKAVANAKRDAEAAQKSAQKAKEEKERVEKEKEKAIAAMNAANNAKIAAEQDSKNAKDSEVLILQFYERYIELNDKTAKKICSDLKKEIPKGVKAKIHLNNLFKKSDNNYRRVIISAIDAAKKTRVEDSNSKQKEITPTKKTEDIIDSVSIE